MILWIAVPKASAVGTALAVDGAGGPPAPSSNALRIAEERYARGEITADELARIRGDLTGP